MSLRTALNNTLSPINDDDRRSWDNFLESIGDDFFFYPEPRHMIEHLVLFNVDEGTGKENPNLYIHTDPIIQKIDATYPIGVEMNVENRTLLVEESIDLDLRTPLPINLDFYNAEGQMILNALMDNIQIPEENQHDVFEAKTHDHIVADITNQRGSVFGARLYKLRIQDIAPEVNTQREFVRYLLYFFHDKVSVMKKFVLEEGLKIKHFIVMRPSLRNNLFNNRLFELFFGLMGTEYYYFLDALAHDPNFEIIEADDELLEAYNSPDNVRCMRFPYDMIVTEPEEGHFIEFATVHQIKPINLPH